MNKIFGSDTLFFRAVDKLGNIIGITIMWLIGCLPVVTIGVSCTAMYYTMAKSVRKGEGYVMREFLGAYKRNLKNAFIMTLVFFALGALLYLDRTYADSMESEAAAFMSAGYTLLIFVAAGLFIYVWPVMSRFTMGKWDCFKLAFLMLFRHLPYTVLFVALWFLGAAAVFLIPVPMAFVLPGLCCYAQTFFMEKLLRKYMPAPVSQDDMDKWYYRD